MKMYINKLILLTTLYTLATHAMDHYTLDTINGSYQKNTKIAFSRDGKTLFVGMINLFHLIDVTENTKKTTLITRPRMAKDLGHDYGNSYGSIDALAPMNETTLAIASANIIGLFDITTICNNYEEPYTRLLEEPYTAISNLSRLSPTLLMSCAKVYDNDYYENQDTILNLWDIRSDKQIKNISCENAIKHAGVLSEHELYFINDGALKIYDIQADAVRVVKKSYDFSLYLNCACTTENTLLCGNPTVKEYNLHTGEKIQTFKTESCNYINALLHIPKTNLLVAGTKKGVCIWNHKNGQLIEEALKTKGDTTSLAYASSQNIFALGIEDHIEFWRAKTKEEREKENNTKTTSIPVTATPNDIALARLQLDLLIKEYGNKETIMAHPKAAQLYTSLIQKFLGNI